MDGTSDYRLREPWLEPVAAGSILWTTFVHSALLQFTRCMNENLTTDSGEYLRTTSLRTLFNGSCRFGEGCGRCWVVLWLLVLCDIYVYMVVAAVKRPGTFWR